MPARGASPCLYGPSFFEIWRQGQDRMLIGLLMILVPVAVYILSLPLSGRMMPGLRMAYRIVGGLVVFLGGGISFYLAWYSGEQGGIAAYFFQKAVILIYAAFSILLIVLNWILCARQSGKARG